MSLSDSIIYRAEQDIVFDAIVDLLYSSSYSVIMMRKDIGKVICSTPQGLLLSRQIVQMNLSSTDHDCRLSIHIESAVVPGGWWMSLYQRLLRRYIFCRLDESGFLRIPKRAIAMKMGVADPSVAS